MLLAFFQLNFPSDPPAVGCVIELVGRPFTTLGAAIVAESPGSLPGEDDREVEARSDAPDTTGGPLDDQPTEIIRLYSAMAATRTLNCEARFRW